MSATRRLFQESSSRRIGFADGFVGDGVVLGSPDSNVFPGRGPGQLLVREVRGF